MSGGIEKQLCQVGVRHSMLSRLSFRLRLPISAGVTLHVGHPLFVPRQCVAFVISCVLCCTLFLACCGFDVTSGCANDCCLLQHLVFVTEAAQGLFLAYVFSVDHSPVGGCSTTIFNGRSSAVVLRLKYRIARSIQYELQLRACGRCLSF